MSDYDDVALSSAPDEEDVQRVAHMPKPHFALHKYYREIDDGPGITMFNSLTPRAGGESLNGEYDRSDEGQIRVE
jgi:hypothetical protein